MEEESIKVMYGRDKASWWERCRCFIVEMRMNYETER